MHTKCFIFLQIDGLQAFQDLKGLDVSDNSLSTLEDLPRSLKWLKASGNKIRKISGLKNLQNLHVRSIAILSQTFQG
jgi:Leucine-rich repeat (LRR) protein